jgi:hypothetical protein
MPLLSAAFDDRSHDAQARYWLGAFSTPLDALSTLAIRLRERGRKREAQTVEFLGKTLDGVGASVVESKT